MKDRERDPYKRLLKAIFRERKTPPTLAQELEAPDDLLTKIRDHSIYEIDFPKGEPSLPDHLISNGIFSIGQLLGATSESLLDIPRMGPVILSKLKSRLREYGEHYREE